MLKVCRILLLSIFFIFLSSMTEGQIRVNRTIECSWLEYDFGEIKAGETVFNDLIIKNISAQSLIVEHVINGCSCVSAEINRKKIRPGKQATISIRFNTKGKPLGENRQNIVVCTSDGKTYCLIIKALLT